VRNGIHLSSQDLLYSVEPLINGPMYLNAANTQKVPDWTRLDMGARYMFERSNGKLITLCANVNNVLGENYWDANAFGQLTLNGSPSFLGFGNC
jgi:iron complex outermembrane receptor protein